MLQQCESPPACLLLVLIMMFIKWLSLLQTYSLQVKIKKTGEEQSQDSHSKAADSSDSGNTPQTEIFLITFEEKYMKLCETWAKPFGGGLDTEWKSPCSGCLRGQGDAAGRVTRITPPLFPLLSSSSVGRKEERQLTLSAETCLVRYCARHLIDPILKQFHKTQNNPYFWD